MERIFVFAVPAMILITLVTIVFGLLIKIKSRPKKRVLSITILTFGVTIDIIVIILSNKLNKESELCRLDPECMNEVGLVYLVYYFILFVGTIIALIGIIKTIRSFINFDKKK